MIYSGKAALDYLANKVDKQDPGESSHWQKYHTNFAFTGSGFEGLQGFGGNESPYIGPKKWLHRLFQRRYRHQASGFPDFHKIDKNAYRITQSEGRAYDLDVLRQAITVAFLKYKIGREINKNSIACVIGDGFGSMTSNLLASGLAKSVVLVNLNRTLLVDLWYLQKWIASEGKNILISLVTDKDDISNVSQEICSDSSQRVIAIQADNHHLLSSLPIDLVVNIVSMQEMDPDVISAYFKDLREVADSRTVYFYCCNREEKELPDGTITRFGDYPWLDGDEIIEDELCPWHQQYYSFRPPFYKPYDGPIRHRLVKLK